MNEELQGLVKPLMKWLAENKNPHTSIIITSTDAEVLEGTECFNTSEFIPD